MMSLFSHLRDPLSLNPISLWLGFTSKFPELSSQFQASIAESSPGEVLSLASRFLLLPSYTAVVADAFRPLLLDLCARWLENSEALEDKLSALCFLLQPQTEIFPVLSAFLQESVPKSGPLSADFMSAPPESAPPTRLQRVLLAYYRILMANPELPNWLDWPLEPLSRLFGTPHPDIGVRYLAIRCYAMQSGMSEAEREKLENTLIGPMAHIECPLEVGLDVHGHVNVIDGWLLPVLETQRIYDLRNAIATDTRNSFTGQGNNFIRPFDLSPRVTSVHGVLIFRSRTTVETPATPLVPTNTSITALRALALYVSLRLPVLLTSTRSSGKRLLLSHLASTLYPGVTNQLLTVNLADTSLDGRSLLGSYVQSERSPGTFEWKDGVLVRAMRTGRWVILQDVDKGSNDVLGTLKPLIESLDMGKWIGGRARVAIPSRGEVVASESFAIFATRSLSVSGDGPFPPPTFLGAHKFFEVIIPDPTQEELHTIIAGSFPKLSGSAARGIVVLWSAIKAIGPTTTDRDIGLRDLRKYCSRLESLLPASYRPLSPDPFRAQADDVGVLVSVFPNPSLREEMFLEARDVFFGAGSLTTASRSRTTTIAAIVVEHLGLPQEKCDWLLGQHAPEVINEMDSNGRATGLRLGRIMLPAWTTKPDMTPPPTRPFVIHRHAATLMSRMAVSISMGEPVLLTGETGTGKTSVITHLASLLHRPLISVNLSQQTESSDLLGSFKPIDARVLGTELQLQFLDLFRSTFSQKKNLKFEESTWKAVKEGKWKRVGGLWKESVRLAKDRIRSKLSEASSRRDSPEDLDSGTPRKRRRKEESHFQESERNWSMFEREVLQFEAQYITKKGKFAFGFVEGPLVRALRSGDWILLDEINLASAETLEAVSTLLHDPASSVTLIEQGSMEPIPRHPDFRIFACMNPATDAGKKELPPSIRSYFTEIEVSPPDTDRETLLAVITQYIGPYAVSDKSAIMDVAEFYVAVKTLAANRRIADASNRRPHFSMRTLARALTFAAEIASAYSLRRALWEGCLMGFTMTLGDSSAEIVTTVAQKHILNGIRNVRLLLTREPAPPQSRSLGDFIKLGPFYLEKGDLAELPSDDYILTPSVERKIVDLARIISTRKFPVLIEGPTSSGKTSTVEFLAKRTGHHFVRINNHECTDIQEYLGTYVSDPTSGKLVFKDGLLVQALRRGDWVVLDELNLAPTDVLEALNRLLDDNRELFISETQEVIKPHPHFMLFATQNPPGLYAGRKVLSRAFRSRFLEVHFDDVPQAELETILCQRCRIAPSYAQRIVAVFRELQKRRQTDRVFESKHGFATLRDLFRWAGRDALGYQQLAENGYMLLAERARREDDKVVVKSVIESIIKVRIDEATLYNFDRFGDDLKVFLDFDVPSLSNVVWTKAMQRLLTLVGRALRSKEPVLLVGETGSGKTSVCQVYADAINKHLISLNCHQNTETADLIGGLRPIRTKAAFEAETFGEVSSLLLQCGITGIPNETTSLLSAIDQLEKSELVEPSKAQEARQKLQRAAGIFEWRDGPLVEVMKAGDVLLLDEISLADDSVLERLNSVLEPARTIVLAEKGGDSVGGSLVQAAPGFRLIATMNPGGDYGKKELSPALRNRFTEIWVPPVNEREDLTQIVRSSWRHESLKPYTHLVLDFIEWLSRRVSEPSLFGLRDIIAWITFSNSILDNPAMKAMPLSEIFHHGAHMACLDGLGSLSALSGYSMIELRKLKDDALLKLQEMVPTSPEASSSYTLNHDIDHFVQLGPFAIPKGPRKPAPHTYDIQAPTTRDNAVRLARASQLSKPILVEGSPGVGKTSLIATLANICGYRLCRINLSDQTDLADLFGSDLPVDGGHPGEFVWKEADFLKAMQEGHWVLLDEMNLAPQSVLEGLNAVLDHRGAVYVPELGRSFSRHPSFRIFAAQNPIQQGGGRKGLPKSYINRFTRVFVDLLTPADVLQISKNMFPKYPEDWLQRMIVYTSRLEEETSVKHSFGRSGSPWDFNLRDIFRWGVLLHGTDTPLHPVEHLRTTYLSRFRNVSDRLSACALFDSVFNLASNVLSNTPHPSISSSTVRVGHFIEGRKSSFKSSSRPGVILQAHLPWIEAMGIALQQGWLVIISGPPNSGKTSLVRVVAELTGNSLQEIFINHATDTTDILGSYEQVDGNFRAVALVRRTLLLSENVLRTSGGSKSRAVPNLGHLREATANPLPIDSLPDLLRMALDTLEDLVDLSDHGVQEKFDLQEGLRAELVAPKIAGQFEWVDGPLVRALKEGHWLLLDNANLCSPSVLDRLNSLCEPSGILTLNERGLVDGITPVIVPHPNFRLIMCVDPQLGELSRAMRNRGIEISLSLPRNQEDMCRLQDFYFLPSPPCHSDANCMSPLEFEAVRRCLQSVSPVAMTTTWPSATAVVGNSSASAVVDRASLILSRSVSDLQPPPLAVLNFFVRSMIPAYTNYFSRFISGVYSSDRSGPLRNLHLLLDMASGDSIWSKLGQTRQFIWPEASTVGSTQSMDFFMKSPTHSLPSTEADHLTAPSIVLRIYELFVRTTCDRFEEASLLHPNVRDDDRTNILSRAILTCMDELTMATYRHGANILRELPKHFTRELSAEIQLILDLLKYATFLRRQPYSAVNFSLLQVAASWIQEALRLAPVHLPSISRLAELLSRAVASTSGLGLNDIWSSWTDSISSNPPIPGLEEINLDADDSGDEYKIRSQLLEYIAARYLKTCATPPANFSPRDVPVLPDLEQISHRAIASNIEVPKTNKISVIRELGILVNMPDENSLHLLDQIIDLACSDRPMSLQRFITYLRATCTAQSGRSGVAGTILSAFGSWLQALWDHDDPCGPSVLFRPTELSMTVQACNFQGVTLHSVSVYQKALEHHSRLLTTTGNWDSTRIEDITALLCKTLLLLASCFHQSFDDSTLKELQGAYRDSHSISVLLPLLRRSSYPWFAVSVDHHFSGTVARIGRGESRSTTLRNLGLDWISLFWFFMDLYIPDTPLDPAASQNSRSEFWSAELASLSHELELEINLECRISGNMTNGTINYLNEQRRHFRERLNDISHIPRTTRRDIFRLREFWSEVSQFMFKIITGSRLKHLVDALHTNSPEALASEHVIQESIARFRQRLESAYPEFDDISRPLRSALLYLRLGLRLVANTSVCGEAAAIEEASHALVAFPSVGGATALIAANIRDLHAAERNPFEPILLVMAAVAFEVELGIDARSRIIAIENVYEQAVRLWLINQKKQEEADVASQSLYRTNQIAHNARNESELEEEDFLALFPDYEAFFDSNHSQEIGSGPISPLDGSYTSRLTHLHLRIMTPGSYPPSAQTCLSELRVGFLASILDKYQNNLPETLDNQSLPHQLSLLAARLRDLHHHDDLTTVRPYNFYIHSHVPEIRRAATLVELLMRGIDALIQEWPDQMVLQHLRNRCAQILSLSAQSPVAKVLVLLEQLLLQIDDWEMYASQETTLKKHRSAITELVISWRRLELSSWRGFLQTQAASVEEGASEWWFRLYNAIVRGILDIVDCSRSSSLDDYLDQLVPLLDGFLKSSPLGQFPRRLGLLRSFGPLLEYLTLIKSERTREPLHRVQRIVYSTQTYYSQFLPLITSSLASQERAASTEIQGFIKIASWKDVNVEALKASAKKTHHQLYKVIRKYRDFMRQPVDSLLQPERVSDTEMSSDARPSESPFQTNIVDDSSLLTHMSLDEGPVHLRDLSKTYRKFDSLITSRIGVFIKSRPFHDLDNLKGQIISTAKELASVNSPVGATAERREKLWKALSARKRKAWSDFAKEFKRIGLATNVQSTILLQQGNDRWLREQPFPDRADNFADVEISEHYFVRLQGLLPRLRATLANHHGDVSTQELRRSIMLLESALSVSLNCRSKLAIYLNEYTRLKWICQRLISIHQSSGIVAWGLTVSNNILDTEETVTRMCHAIPEAIHKIKEFGDLPGASPAPITLLEGLQMLLSSTQECRIVLRSIVENLKETELPILLRDELDTVAFAQRHIANAQNLFLEWEKGHPQYSLIILPLREWLASQLLCIPRGDQLMNPSDPGSDEVIEALLKSIQSALSVLPGEDQAPVPDQDNYLRDTSSSLIRIGDLLRLDSKVALMNTWIEQLVGCPSEEIKKNVSRILPFIQRYVLLVEELLACLARWMNSLFRLQLTACSAVLNIATNGFCKPPDGEELGDGSTADDSGGVGFGEGAGNENVSKEIEDGSQVEGLKDESSESNRKGDKDRENNGHAIEINDYFQGELEDIPESGSEEEQPTEEDKQDPEETLGDLDVGDPDSVDEKLWGDEAGPQSDSKQEKTSKDHSNNPSADSEVVAKDDKSPNDHRLSKEKKPDASKTRDEDSSEELKDDGMPEDEADEDNGENAPAASGAALDDLVQDSDTLDLPDGLEMDEDPTQQDVGEEVDEDDASRTADADSPKDDDDMQLEPSSEMSSHPKDETNEGESLDGQHQKGEEPDTGLDDFYPDKDVSMQSDVRTGNETSNEAVPDSSLDSNVRKDPSESSSGGAHGAMPADMSEEARCEDVACDELLEKMAAEKGHGDGGADASAEASMRPSYERISQSVLHDPPRSLGDSFKETIWHSDSILESDNAPAEQVLANPDTSHLQHLHGDDVDHDMQALGPAGPDEVVKLNELHLVDDAHGPNNPNQMDVDNQEHPTPKPGFLPPPLLTSESPERAVLEGTPGALLQNEVQSQRLSHGADVSTEQGAKKVEVDEGVPLVEYVELALRQWQADGQPLEGAQNLWRLYESLTQDLSYALCEQLRLILEPTLATRLKGDYRSGKRLNMKKIIPYIASEYTKDKIWLRRTRPSQREYQVFLALDDSRSMAESHSIHLAYETLALVSRALSRLEVGDIGIAKFGETVDVLHGFDDGPLTDQAAMQVMTAFTFNQKATNVLALVEASLGILEAAREGRLTNSSSAGGDLWQLEIIISDGLCQDHEKLCAALRQAQEQRVMMVFIIIDSLHSNVAPSADGSEGGGTGTSQNSILSMQQVAYKNVEGRMELQMQRYLDTFPFDYYVVLRDVEALPEVLSGTVRQFFERISDV